MSDLLQLSPVVIVACVGLLVLVIDLFRGPEVRGGNHLAWMTTIGLAVALAAIWKLWPGSAEGLTHPLFAGGLSIDGYTLFFWAFLLVMTAVSVLSSGGFDSENNLDHGEYYSFYAFALVGMMLMVAATQASGRRARRPNRRLDPPPRTKNAASPAIVPATTRLDPQFG